jgi:hypothetical protein
VAAISGTSIACFSVAFFKAALELLLLPISQTSHRSRVSRRGFGGANMMLEGFSRLRNEAGKKTLRISSLLYSVLRQLSGPTITLVGATFQFPSILMRLNGLK